MKPKITLSNIKGYLSAHYRQALDELGFLESHVKEQALFRLWLVKQRSPECYETNSCKECGCEVSSRVFENRACEGSCYGEILPKDSWEEFKKISPAFKKFISNNWTKFNIKEI